MRMILFHIDETVDLQGLNNKINTANNEFGLTLNTKKTKSMLVTNKNISFIT